MSTGPGGATRVKVFDGKTGSELANLLPYGSSFTNGAFVGAVPGFPPVLLNIATRINVRPGDNALIGGFIVEGTEPKRMLIRGMGPSTGVPGALQDPMLELNDATSVLASNDNWKETQRREIEASSIPPQDDAESAIVRTLAPGAYTAILRGKDDSTGIGLIEIYDLEQAADAKQANISSRGFVDTGDNVLIGGFIVGGSGATGRARCAVRAIGPSLAKQGLPAVQNPTLQLVDASGSIVGEMMTGKRASRLRSRPLACSRVMTRNPFSFRFSCPALTPRSCAVRTRERA